MKKIRLLKINQFLLFRQNNFSNELSDFWKSILPWNFPFDHFICKDLHPKNPSLINSKNRVFLETLKHRKSSLFCRCFNVSNSFN